MSTKFEISPYSFQSTRNPLKGVVLTEWLDFLDAINNGKTIQIFDGLSNKWIDLDEVSFCESVSHYRIKRVTRSGRDLTERVFVNPNQGDFSFLRTTRFCIPATIKYDWEEILDEA